MPEHYAIVRAGVAKFSFTKFHEDYDEAVKEAIRLAELEKDRFFVLKMVGYAHQKPNPVEFVGM